MKAFTSKIKTAVMLAVLCLAGQTAFCQYGIHHYSITAANRVDLPDFTEIDTSIIRNVNDDVIIEYVRDKSNGVGYFHIVYPHNWMTLYPSCQRQTVRIPFRINDMVIFGDSLYFCGTNNENQPVFGWLSVSDIGNNSSTVQIKYVVTPRLQDVFARFGGNTFLAYTPRKLQLFQIGEVKHIVAIASALYSNRPMTPPTLTLPTDSQPFVQRLILGETDLLLDIVLAKNNEEPLDPNTAYSFPYKVYFSVDHMPADELEDNSAFLTYDNLAVTDGFVSVVGHVKQAKLNGMGSNRQEIINCVFAKPERILDTSIFNDGEREGRQTKSVFYIPSHYYSHYYHWDNFHSEFVDDQNGNRALSKVQVIDGGNDQIIFASEAFCVKSRGSNMRYDGIAVAKMKMPSDPNIYNEKFYETKDAAPNRAPKTPVKALVGYCSGWESPCTPDGEYAFLFDDFSDSSNPISYIIDSKNNVIGSSGSYVAISDENVNFLNSISRHIDCWGMPVLSGSSKYDDGYSSYMFRQCGLIAGPSNTCYDTDSGIIHIGHKEYSAKTIKNHPWIASSRVAITKEKEQKYPFTADSVCVVVEASSKNSEKSTAKMIQNSIVPNPAHEKFTISSDEYISYIEVVTFDGQTIKTEQVNDYSKEVNVSGSKKGVYMVRIHYKNADVEIMKLVIQ